MNRTRLAVWLTLLAFWLVVASLFWLVNHAHADNDVGIVSPTKDRKGGTCAAPVDTVTTETVFDLLIVRATTPFDTLFRALNVAKGDTVWFSLAASALPEGNSLLTAYARDDAGILSCVSAARQVSVDRRPPVAPSIVVR